MVIFRKSDQNSREKLLNNAVESARKIMRAHGHISYRNKDAFYIGIKFINHLEDIYRLGGCDSIANLMGEAGKDRKYFYDKLNWFYKKYCSS